MKLELKDIHVTYSYKTVLDGVNVSFDSGKIYALLGDNGAGKSTMANVICGEVIPSSGAIFFNGKEVAFKTPKDALSNGIAYVHQFPMLSNIISIKENLVVGVNKKHFGKLKEIIDTFLPETDLNTKVEKLGADSRFFVALSSALLKEPQFLILDEPSALLGPLQSKFLYEQLESLAKNGMTILVITHNLNEAENYCHQVYKLKNGKIEALSSVRENYNISDAGNGAGVGTGTGVGADGSRRDSSGAKDSAGADNINTEGAKKDSTYFEITVKNHLCSKGISLKPFNIVCRENQITLIQGSEDDGLLQLEKLVTGALVQNDKTNRFEGMISLNSEGKKLSWDLKKKKYNFRRLRNNGLVKTGIIPTDRKYTGSHPSLTISDVLFPCTNPLEIQQIIKNADINIQSNEKCANLSGGMLQRLIFSRELFYNPKLVIMCNPLHGLDVTAQENTCKKIKETADKGAVVLVLSSAEFPKTICKESYSLKNGTLELLKGGSDD